MPEAQAQPSTELTFTDGELAALRGIVTDWINEQIGRPPLPADFDAVIQKLEIQT